MDFSWLTITAIAAVAAVFALACAGAAIWGAAEQRHRLQRSLAGYMTPSAPDPVKLDVELPAVTTSAAATSSDAARRDQLLQDTLERMTRPGALNSDAWEDTVPSVAASGVLPHDLTRESVSATPPAG